MSRDKIAEKEKILQIVKKYKDYFNEWDADVALGVNGKHIFYVLASRKEFETFLFFQTANQLEKIILGTLAENLDIILDAGIDEIFMGFTADDVDEKSEKSIENYLPLLVKRLDVLCKAEKNWSNMLQKTFNSLKNVCSEIVDREAK